jgi:formyltetrahydrofolate hydrolase
MRLEDLIKKIDRLRPGTDPELIAHWTRYLCVLLSGMIEVCVQEYFSDYARVRSERRVYSYVEVQLQRLQNPKMEKIVSVAAMFDSCWAERLQQQTKGELKDSVDSVVANRNLIAHGESVGLSFSRLQEYHKAVCEVLDLVRALCTA